MLPKNEVDFMAQAILEEGLAEAFLQEERVATLGETTDWSMWQIADRLKELIATQ